MISVRRERDEYEEVRAVEWRAGKDWFSMPAMCISQTQLVTQPSTPKMWFLNKLYFTAVITSG